MLSNYITALNHANEVRDSSLLDTIETDSSFTVDSEAYSWTKVTDPSNDKYAPMVVAHATFYIPRQISGRSWWTVYVTWARGQQFARANSAYLVFVKAVGRWMVARSPGLLSGVSVPAPAIGRQGSVSEVTDSHARSLAVQPSEIASLAATYLNQLTVPQCLRPGLCSQPPSSKVQVTEAASLLDMSDLNFWRSQAGGALIVDDQHSPATDQIYAMKTANGGALVWCDVRAELTLAGPGGSAMHLQIPTFYTDTEAVTDAKVPYIDQFLVYDPPEGQGTARVVANFNGPIAKG